MLKRRPIALILALLLALSAVAAWAADEDEETRIGREAAAQIEKESKILDAPEDVAHLEKIIARLAPQTQRPDVTYTVKILDSDDINAFSIPGGHVYITRGALKAVESEDELAAILAHELAHNAHKHSLDLLRREAKLNARLGVALLAVLVGGGGSGADAGQALLLGELVKLAILHGYTREDEYQADHDGVLYMRAAGYNPVAMLTVMEGFSRLANTRPNQELGVLQTHPYPTDRAQRLVAQLRSLDIPINRRLVTRSLVVKVKDETRDGRPIGQILVDDAVVFEAAVGEDGGTPTERAAHIGSRLTRQILNDLQGWEIRTGPGQQDASIYARGEPLIRVLPEDAALQHESQAALAQQALAKLRMVFWKETVDRAY